MNVTKTAASQHSKTYEMTVTALMTAVTCISSSAVHSDRSGSDFFTNLAIYLSLYLLGWKRGTISYLVYLLIRSGRRSGILQVHRRNRQACRSYRWLHHRFHRHGSDRRTGDRQMP